MKEIEKYAQLHHVPIIEGEPALFISEQMKKYNVQTMLEIGSAIGYSALFFKREITQLKIDTIEKDELRYQMAVDNIARLDQDKDICCHFDDALTIPFDTLKYAKYDAIFIDAAKYRTLDFFERFEPLLNTNGIIIIDNLFLRGWIYRLDEVKTKRKRRIVKKAANIYKWLVEDCEGYIVEIHEIGDGLAICKRRNNGKNNNDNQ